MATFYVRTAGGNASTAATYSQDGTLKAAGAASATTPTAADDISLESASGSYNMSGGANCNNFTMQTGYSGTLTNIPGASVSFAGSATLVSTCTISGSVTTGGWIYTGTSGTGTFTSAGKSIGSSITANGVGGTLAMGDDWAGVYNLTVNFGSFVSNNHNATITNQFSYANTNTKSITLGTSTFTYTAAAGTPINGNMTGTTWSGASATFVISATGSTTLTTGVYGSTYVSVLTAHAPSLFTLSNLLTVGTFNRNTTSAGAQLVHPGLTCTTAFNVTGTTSFYQTVLSTTYGTQRTITLTGATVTCNNVVFEDMAVSGTTLTGTNIGDAGNISGITATTAAAQFLIGAAGNWEDATKWSLTSGGTNTGRVPLPQDDVTIDSSSPTSVTFTGSTHISRSLTVTKASFNFAGTTRTVYIHGSITLASTTTWSSTVSIVMRRPSTTGGLTAATITSNGAVWGCTSLTVDRRVGTNTTTMADGLNLGTTATLFTTSGSFSTATFAVACGVFSCGPNASGTTVTTSGSTFTLNAASGSVLTISSTGNLTFVSDASTLFDIVDTSGSNKTITVARGAPGTIRYIANNTAACSLTINNANSTNLPTFVCNNNGSTFQKSIVFAAGFTHTITDLQQITGDPANPIVLKSGTTSSTATLTKASGTVTISYVTLQDITATGGATWNANNSTAISNVSGWNFNGAATGPVSAATFTSPTGSVTGDGNVAGPVATLSLAAPAGTAAGTASGTSVTGVVSTASLTAPAGTSTGDGAVPGVVAAEALAAPAGSVSSGSVVTGPTAATTLTAPAGTTAASAAVSGAVSTEALSAPTGTVQGSAQITGVVAALALSAPAGSLAVTATVTGVVSTLSLTAPAGTASGVATTNVNGVVATATLAAPAGAVTTTAVVAGVTASVALAAPVGAASIAVSVTGVTTGLSTAAPAGTLTGTASVAGVTAGLSTTAPVGSVVSASSVAGVTAGLGTAAPVGVVRGSATITGPVTTLVLVAPAGTAVGTAGSFSATVVGTLSTIATHAVAGSVGVNNSVTGVTSTLVFTAYSGAVSLHHGGHLVLGPHENGSLHYRGAKLRYRTGTLKASD